jgi:glycosyltransferase involved in cell wall biosynthesis
MKLSIITTVYQAEKDLPRLLDSMMAQKSQELEFFLIDNGCTDNSAAICKEYAAKDTRFKIHTLPQNIGYIAARNLGLQIIDADYIGFCDSDDFIECGGYDRAIEIIKNTNCDLYIGSYNILDSNRANKQTLPFSEGLYSQSQIETEICPFTFGPSKHRSMLRAFMWKQIFRKSIIDKENMRFNPACKPCEDILFNADYIHQSKSIYIDSNVLYNYVAHNQSITATLAREKHIEDNYAREYLTFVELMSKCRNDVERLHVYNCSMMSIWGLVSSIVRLHKDKDATQMAKLFKHVTGAEYISDVIQHCSYGLSLKVDITHLLLRLHFYRILFSLVKFVLK